MRGQDENQRRTAINGIAFAVIIYNVHITKLPNTHDSIRQIKNPVILFKTFII